MTLKEFQSRYQITCNIQTPDNINLIVLSMAVQRKDNTITDSVKTIIEIPATNSWIQDNQSAVSLNTWTWEKVIDYTRRAQLDYFAQRVPIENYYPLNKEDNPDISIMYI